MIEELATSPPCQSCLSNAEVIATATATPTMGECITQNNVTRSSFSLSLSPCLSVSLSLSMQIASNWLKMWQRIQLKTWMEWKWNERITHTGHDIFTLFVLYIHMYVYVFYVHVHVCVRALVCVCLFFPAFFSMQNCRLANSCMRKCYFCFPFSLYFCLCLLFSLFFSFSLCCLLSFTICA